MGGQAASAAERLRWRTIEQEPTLPDLDVGQRVTHPEFAGMEFLHVRAKSLLNEVPAAAGLPFRWTINAYRGCSHACSYCLAGETPVLMADGTTRPISQLQPGDRVLGTRREGRYRRYIATDVLDHWQTTRRAHRITLEDGTRIVASGDHRFLTERGWKHVTGAECGHGRRPHLTTNNALLGTGGFADPPKQDASYRVGYLCGMIRGDANLGTYRYERVGRAHGDLHRFRLALADLEALDRTTSYLAAIGIEVDRFTFTEANDRHRRIEAIRSQRQDTIARLQELIAWPVSPSDEWRKGFLAGIFDAEGSCSRGVWRVSNTDEEIVAWLRACLQHFGFRTCIEYPRSGLQVVRLLGGLRERQRFFFATDPASTRKRSIEGAAMKGNLRLRVIAVEDLGVEVPMYDITTGTGDFIASGAISHNCFARPSHTWLDLDAGRDFEKVVVVKVNAVERLRAELRRPSWQGEAVALGTNTDPYQRAEGRYRLTRGVVQTLADAGNPFSVLTKGTLVTRDLDILADAAGRGVCTGVSMSIPTLDEDVWRSSEPGTPHPRARLETIAKLADAGVPTGVMLAPILPGMSDDDANLEAIVQAAIEAGAGHITPILLHLRPGVREVFLPWLQSVRPDLVAAYEQWYRRAYAPKAMRDDLARRVGRLIQRHGPLRTTSTPRLRDLSPAGRTTPHTAGRPGPATSNCSGPDADGPSPDPDGEQLSLL